MNSIRFAGLALLILAAGCAKKDSAENLDADVRDLSLAPVDTTAELSDVSMASDSTATEPPAPEGAPPPAPPPTTPARPTASRPAAPPPAPAPAPAPPPAPAPAPSPAPATRSVAAGATMALTAATEFGSKTHQVGETITATVANDVTDENGNVMVPAGAKVTLEITEMTVSENKSDSGKIVLRATQVAFGGETYALAGTSSQVAYSLKGRGVKAGDAAKVGAGAAAGAVIGRVLSGKKKGTVVGGVIGAAAGTAVAANSADRDILVAQGARIVIKLTQALELKA